MAKKSSTKKGLRKTPSGKKAGAASRAAKASKGGRRKTAAAGTPKGKARRKRPTNPRAGKLKSSARKAAAPARRKTSSRAIARRTSPPKRGGAGREETLAQTPETGRSRRGPTNPMPTRRSTGTPAGAGTTKSPRLERARRQLREIEEGVPTPPSSLDLDRGPSAARSGRQHLQDAQADHNETSPVMTGGDVDADWEDAYSVGDEAPGGDNPTPDQDRVDDIGKALGVTYDDNEELKASDKIADRDKHRWELDPASSEDYTDRD
jgi:Family of unknown function (DUF6335)